MPEHPGLVVRDSAGVRIVENTTPLWQPGQQWRLSAEPVLEIGGGDSEENQLFRVMGALRLSDGFIVIANGGSYELRFYDPSGVYRGSAGGRGDGPGQFQGIRWIAKFDSDSLITYDFIHRRLSFHGPEGVFLRSLTLRSAGPTAVRALGMFASGGFLASESASRDPLKDGLSRPDVRLLFYGRDGELADPFGNFTGGEASIRTGSEGASRSFFVFPPHFGHSTLFRVHNVSSLSQLEIVTK